MTDFFVRQVPLPLPRPVIEEVVPGADNPGFKLDIPIPEMSDIDLSFPLVGIQWVLYPYNYVKGIMMEPEVLDTLSIVGLFTGGAVATYFVFLGLSSVVRWFTKDSPL